MPKQAMALKCPTFEMGYGGAPGGGKSDYLLVDALSGIRVPGYRALLLRRKISDLQKLGGLIDRSQSLFRDRGDYDAQKHVWKFPNDCKIEFGHCQRENDIENYQSAQYAFIGIEQSEQFSEKMYTYFFSRVRSVNPQIQKKFRCAFNPGGIGHTFLKKRFWIGERKPYFAYKVEDKLKMPDGKEEAFSYDRCFIPALVYDNEHIMKNDRAYLMRLMQLPEPKRTAYLEGRFDLFEGQYFGEWDEKLHACIPFQIPAHWRRSVAFDWGYKDKTCVLWFAEDPATGIVYCYREYVVNETLDLDVAKMIQKLSEGEVIFAIYYPHDLDHERNGVSMHERMDDATDGKYYWIKGNKERVQGWNAVRHLMSIRPDGLPRMRIFNTCRYLIQTIPEQVYDEDKTEDLDTLADDHGVDALRYFAATYRAIDEVIQDKPATHDKYDVGGAVLIVDKKTRTRQFQFKQEDQSMAFQWAAE